MQNLKHVPANSAVNDELVLTDEEMKRLATIFDVLIEVAFQQKYKKAEQ